MMITQLERELLRYAPEITQTATEKGFWSEGENRDKGEMVMLMVSELGECLEAHRKGRTFDPQAHLVDWSGKDEDFPDWFGALVKDSVQDEMADTVIRMLDYINGWKISFVEREYRKTSTGNFGRDLLRLNWYLLRAYHSHIEELDPVRPMSSQSVPGMDWGYALAAICRFCEWYDIDILQHVRWKLIFNKTREHMHGKAY